MNNLPHPLEGPPGHVRWNILAVLVAMSFVAYVLRTNMSVAGESMMGELGLSQVELGMVLAAFAWGYALFQFPGGVFGDIFGPRRVLTWIAVCWGIANLAIGLVPGADLAGPGVLLVSLIALRFAMGVVQAPVFPVVAATIRNWFPPGGWALPNALSNAGLTLGAAATGPLIAWLAVTVGWRLSFILTAPLGFVVALVWWRYGRDFPTEHPGVGDAESAFIKAGREPIVAEEPGAWKRVLRDRNVILLTVSYFCMNYVFYIFFNWFFIYLVQVRGFATLEGGFLATLPWLVGAVVWAGAAATNAYLAVALLALCFGCTQLSDPAYWSAITSVGGRHTAAAAGVLNTGGNVVGGFGAILVPLVAERFGWVAALSTGSLMAVVAAVLWLFIRADEPLKT
jgi:ACS family glucarate transporter-like MFS transporter